MGINRRYLPWSGGSVKEQSAWMDRAACRNADSNLFFPESNEDKIKEVWLEYCSGCPVMTECRLFAKRTYQSGIWGGLHYMDGQEKELNLCGRPGHV